MSKTWKERLFLIAFCLLAASGLTFLVLSFLNESDNKFLGIGLGCIAVCNLMTLYRLRKREKEKL